MLQLAISVGIIAVVLAGASFLYLFAPPVLGKAEATFNALKNLPLVGAFVASLSSLLSVKQILKCVTFKAMLGDDYQDCVAGKLQPKDRDEKLVWWEGQLFGNQKEDNS